MFFFRSLLRPLTTSLIATAALAAPSIASADDGKSADTTNEAKTHHGGYGAPEMKLTPIAGSPGLLFGSQGGWIINHTFVVGAAGYGLVNDVRPRRFGVEDAPIELGYGGVRGGVALFSERRLHITGGVLLGGGRVAAGPRADAMTSGGFFVVEPDVAAEINVLDWLRVTLGASHRFTTRPEGTTLRASQLGGVAATLAVKLGSF